MEKNSGRKRHVTGGGKGVHKRGDGLDTGGPVGREDGYAGRNEQEREREKAQAGAPGQGEDADRAGLDSLLGGGLGSLLGGSGGSSSGQSSGSSGGLGGLGSLLGGLGGGQSSGQGTGSGSQSGGYGGGGSGSGGQGSSQGGGGLGCSIKMLIPIILVVVLLAVFLGPSMCGGESAGCGLPGGAGSGQQSSQGGADNGVVSNTGNNGNTGQTGNNGIQVDTSGQQGGSGQQSGGSSGGSGFDVSGLLSGYTGSNNVSNGWSIPANTAVLDLEVANGARPKRTQIRGNGQDQITIMIYMCGTDLESRYGMATKDLQEMCAANLNDKVNILLYTGGCSSWRTRGINNNQIYQVTKNGLKWLADDTSNGRAKNMTDPATLSNFIRWCANWTASNAPRTNRYDLIFWDHGGGSVSGYGYDETNVRSGSMDLSGINRALADGGVSFDFIGFDACLMATLETALVCSNHADYLIGSEEAEPGIGWYYTDWLTSLCANTSQATTETGKNIVDGFVNTCATQCRGQDATLSLVDLAELEKTVPSKMAAFSESTGSLIQSDNYKQVSNARAGSREFAASSRIDQIDLIDFANKLGTSQAKALTETLLSAIKYNRTSSGITNAYGLSIYFPYKSASKVDTMANIYKDIGMDADYTKCIKSFAGVETAGQIASGGSSSPFSMLEAFMGGGSGLSGSSGLMDSGGISSLLSAFMGGGRSIEGIDRAQTEYLDDADAFDPKKAAEYISVNQFDPSYMVWKQNEDGEYVMAIADEQWDLIQSLQMNMFYYDGAGFIDLGLDNVYGGFTDDGRLIGDTAGYWVSVDGQPVAYYYEGTVIEGDTEIITGRVPAMLNGERVNLIIVTENGKGYIAGARPVYIDGETDTVAKAAELNEGDVIEFICDYYGEDKVYQKTYYLGEPVYYTEGMEISDTYVGDDFQVTYLLTDIYNQEYWTPVVPM